MRCWVQKRKEGTNENRNHLILGSFSLKTFLSEQDPVEKKNHSSRQASRGNLGNQPRNSLGNNTKIHKTIYRPKLLAADETVIKINGEKRYLWAAIDVESRGVLAVWITTIRNWWIVRDFSGCFKTL